MHAGKILYIVHACIWDTFSLQLYRWEQKRVQLMFFMCFLSFLKMIIDCHCGLVCVLLSWFKTQDHYLTESGQRNDQFYCIQVLITKSYKCMFNYYYLSEQSQSESKSKLVQILYSSSRDAHKMQAVHNYKVFPFTKTLHGYRYAS